MSYRELLRLAAKAAGIDVRENRYGCEENPFCLSSNTVFDGLTWNPLSSNDDAIELSHILNISFEWDADCSEIRAYVKNGDVIEHFYACENGDSRRAIVMVAANIQKAREQS